MPEVSVRVKISQKQYVILRDPKMVLHTKFWITTWNEIQICFQLDLSRTEARGQGHSDAETVVDTLRPKDVSTYQILESMSYNIGDMQRTRFL